MRTTINNIELNLIKTNSDWGVYPGKQLLPIWMQWNGKAWVFASKETPAELKAIEKGISDYIVEHEK